MHRQMVRLFVAFAGVVLVGSLAIGARAQEPPAINPFAPRNQDRPDAVLGYLELSDGQVFAGRIYMTRDKRLKIYDETLKRQREIPLRAVSQIECHIKREWMEKEWRFKELASNEKYYTGRTYPAREYVHTITLKDGRTVTGPLSEIIYVEPLPDDEQAGKAAQTEPLRVILHKRDKGPIGTDLKSLKYVKLVKLGEDAYEEGKRKAAKRRRTSASSGK